MKPTILWGSVSAVGIVGIVVGVLTGWVIKPSVLHGKLNLNNENSEGYEYFITPPVDVIIKFYFMEVTNSADVLAGSAKPMLKESGPYAYRQAREKKDLNSSSDQFIEFGQYIDYTFDASESCQDCSSSDEVTILNMILFGAISVAVDSPTSGQPMVTALNKAINDGNVKEEDAAPFFKVAVQDFLFDGISSTLVDHLLEATLTKPRLPQPFTGGKFALFNGKVNSANNECYQVETSSASWDRHTMITKYGKDLESLEDSLANAKALSTTGEAKWGSWWPYPDADGNTGENCTCNQLKGTDGQQFPPGVDKNERLWIFNTAPCRSIFMDFQTDQDIEGISTLRYVVPLDGVNVNKTINFCACEELKRCDECTENVTENCFKRLQDDPETLDISLCTVEKCFDGLQDISKCQGAPTYMSYPHFYLAEHQQSYFDGLQPSKDLHETYLNVEPRTGMSVKLHSRIQLNTPLYGPDELPSTPWSGQSELDILQSVKSFNAFPVVWIDQGADIEDNGDMVKHLKSQLRLLNASDALKWVGIGGGAAVFLLGVVMFCVKK